MTSSPPGGARETLARTLETLAMLLVIACVAGRSFIGEPEFRHEPVYSALKVASQFPGSGARSVEARADLIADRGEITRMTFAMVLLGAVVLWVAAGVVRGRLAVTGVPALAAVGVFAALSLASALQAPDKRTGLDGWLEQFSVLTAGMLTMQLAADRGRRAALLLVLAALGGALGAGAIFEYTVERPEFIADFNRDPDAAVRKLGHEPGSPMAKALGYRARDRAVLGPAGMSNPFGAMLVLLMGAGAGLAAQKFAAAAPSRLEWRLGRRPGELHVPTLAAGVTVALPLAAAMAVPMTYSRAGMVSATVALAAMVVAWRYHEALARRWKQSLAVAGCVLLTGGMAVTAWGVQHDGLPSRTMTYRWYYWTGAAQVVAQRPYLGAGPGNFGTLYLQHRRLGADEEVKSPHNVVVEAISTYGLAGGPVYLAILFGMLAAACRPREPESLEATRPSPSPGVMAAAAAVAIVVASLVYPGSRAADMDWRVLLLAAFPAVTVGVTLVVAWWPGRKAAVVPAVGRWARVGLVCGLAGFVLDNTVCYSIWRPGMATVFWVGAGLAVAAAGGGRQYVLRRSRWAVGALAVAGWVGALAVLWMPVARRAALAGESVAALAAGRPGPAADAAVRAARADALDGVSAFDAAHAARLAGRRDCLEWAREAVRRNPFESGYYRLLAGMIQEVDNPGGKTAILSPDALLAWERAVWFNPNGIRLRLERARVLVGAGFWAKAGEELDTVERIDRAFYEGSSERLTAKEKEEILAMRRTCAARGLSPSGSRP